MASVNKVILLGHVGKDPEMRYMPSGDAVATFSIATNSYYKDESGEKQQETEWHRCVAFAKRAETIGQYVKKGDPIYVEGSIHTRKWEKDGVERFATEVVVQSFQFIKSRDRSQDGASADDYRRASGGSAANPPRAPQGGEAKGPQRAGPFDDMEDDIPF